ncbi:MAG: aspartate 1-decarboxylase [Butyricicoccaceae bacterium]
MMLNMLKGKIHRATVVQAGAGLRRLRSRSIRIFWMLPAFWNTKRCRSLTSNNGSRFETYTISGERGSGMICLNGAAARCVSTGDKVIIMCYAQLSAEEAKTHKPQVVFVGEDNRIERITTYEKHGLLRDMA